MLGSIDFFLPYFPLESSNIQELFTKRLVDQSAALLRSDAANLTWSEDVTDFLMSKVWAGRLSPFTTQALITMHSRLSARKCLSTSVNCCCNIHRELDMHTAYEHASI